MALPFVFSLCLLIGLSNGGVSPDDSHRHKDTIWTKTCKEGMRQSPINLVTSDAICTSKTPDITFIDFNQSNSVQVKNNGHTGVITGFHKWTPRPTLKRADMVMDYQLQQMHFHWNMGNNGSEHMIDGKQSAAEMHMVFTLGNMDLTKARSQPAGITVVGVLLDVIPGSKLGISEDLMQVDASEASYKDLHFNLATKIPEIAEYFRYNGSLTTPNCDENVHWIVYKRPMGMSKTELEALRHLHDKEKLVIDHNNRVVQHLNGRPVLLHSPNCRK